MTEPQVVTDVEQLPPPEVTEAKKPDWIYHATDAKLALLITMHNECDTVVYTIKRVRERFSWIGIVRSFSPPVGVEGHDAPFGFLKENSLQVELTQELPDLSGQFSRFELPAQSICRNYSALFSAVSLVPDIDYCVAITGDTALLHPYGIEEIIAAMEKKDALLGCSKACGQDFHRADLTMEELEAGKGGGRKQGMNCEDFMPQLFAVRHEAVSGKGAFTSIEIVNRFTTENCLGAELKRCCADWKKGIYVFAEQAFSWQDGVIYHALTGTPGGE